MVSVKLLATMVSEESNRLYSVYSDQRMKYGLEWSQNKVTDCNDLGIKLEATMGSE